MPPLTCNGALVRKNAVNLSQHDLESMKLSSYSTYCSVSYSCTSRSASRDPTSLRWAFPSAPVIYQHLCHRIAAANTHKNPFVKTPATSKME